MRQEIVDVRVVDVRGMVDQGSTQAKLKLEGDVAAGKKETQTPRRGDS